MEDLIRRIGSCSGATTDKAETVAGLRYCRVGDVDTSMVSGTSEELPGAAVSEEQPSLMVVPPDLEPGPKRPRPSALGEGVVPALEQTLATPCSAANGVDCCHRFAVAGCIAHLVGGLFSFRLPAGLLWGPFSLPRISIGLLV